ncbi:hypothetical protein TSOC_001032 [Tetrabaena socialis]|uniref:Uncharacterized protein n=1 Tax=Tetrabaena socialis TaxID=47790 RepID=A0A2J8AHZ5_9CHLO|nr:hypothetical protein TSOC_001032 [Tetrabaena socialis]|eukprot:PNH12121.1 hypothetical protein TSOC_001032 [Tetrabaena socialis]
MLRQRDHVSVAVVVSAFDWVLVMTVLCASGTSPQRPKRSSPATAVDTGVHLGHRRPPMAIWTSSRPHSWVWAIHANTHRRRPFSIPTRMVLDATRQMGHLLSCALQALQVPMWPQPLKTMSASRSRHTTHMPGARASSPPSSAPAPAAAPAAAPPGAVPAAAAARRAATACAIMRLRRCSCRRSMSCRTTLRTTNTVPSTPKPHAATCGAKGRVHGPATRDPLRGQPRPAAPPPAPAPRTAETASDATPPTETKLNHEGGGPDVKEDE